LQIVQPLEYLSLQVVWGYSCPNGPPGMAGHDTVWHGGAVVPCLIVSPCRTLDPGRTLWSVSRADERGSSSCHPVPPCQIEAVRRVVAAQQTGATRRAVVVIVAQKLRNTPPPPPASPADEAHSRPLSPSRADAPQPSIVDILVQHAGAEDVCLYSPCR